MSFIKSCCTLPPVSSNYQPEGTDSTVINGMTVYETKNKSSKTVLICAYDIFGFHPNVKQFADKLNSTGDYLVVIPDFFRGHSVTEDDLKNDMPKIIAFVGEHGTWDKTVKTDVLKVIEHYKGLGATKFAMFGFCWGGKVSARGACEVDDIKAASLIHPSMLVEQDAEESKVPLQFLPAQDDPDMIPLFDIVKKNLGEDKTEHHRFTDVVHGFCGARGDMNNDVHRQRINEAIGMVHAFFHKHL